MNKEVSVLSAEEKEKRAYNIELLLANMELEGESTDPKVKLKMYDYVNGKITREELSAFLRGQ